MGDPRYGESGPTPPYSQPPPPESTSEPAGPGGRAAAGQPGSPAQRPQGAMIPPVDVVESADTVTVFVDAPGYSQDDIQIQAEGRSVMLTAERHQEYDDDERVVLHERPTRMERTIELPSRADIEAAEAAYEDGVVTVTLPKSEEEQQKTIDFE